MSNSVNVANVPKTVSKEKIEQFFAFCGKIDSVDLLESSEDSNSYNITFISHSAVSTALLLDQAELDGASVIVTGVTTHDLVKSEEGTVSPPSAEQVTTDIAQELKPKAAIFAEYLSQGYVFGEHLIQRAVDYDHKNGYTSKFKRFLADLDGKYNLQEKQKNIQTRQQELDQKYKISSNVTKYFDRALKTDVGGKLHGFYTNIVHDTLQIHEEAKRLAELKKQQSNPAPSS